jgi:hypothetical protein
LLSFPFKSFSESGLFNGLRPIQIKNYPAISGCARRFEVRFGDVAFSSLEACQGPGSIRRLPMV